MTQSLREEREIAQLRESGTRGVLFVPTRGVQQRMWHGWRTVFERAGHPTFAPEPEELSAAEFIPRTTERMLELIDQLGREPHVIGACSGALVALRIADEAGAASTVAIGGAAISAEALGVEPDSGLSGPMMFIGGEQDPELPVEMMHERYESYASGASSEATKLLLRPGTAQSVAFGENWRQTAEEALAFVNGPTRTDRTRRFFSDLWSSLVR